MKGIVRLLIKFFVYVLLIIPLVRGIVGAIFGSGWLGWLVGVIAAIGLALWLESTGTSNKLLARLFSGDSSNTEGQASAPTGRFFESALSGGVETTMKCPNCGSQVTLRDGHGKCKACDSAF